MNCKVMKGLSAKKTKALAALMAEPTATAAARAAGCSEATLWRYTHDPDFIAAYREAKRAAINLAVSRLQQAAGEAVEVLRGVMNSETDPASSRVTAARAILDGALKAVENEDLTARVEILEKHLINEGE